MRIAAAVAVISIALATRAPGQTPCGRAPATAATSFFVEPGPVGARDTVVVARLCLSSRARIGSYTAVLSYDTTRMRVGRVETRGGMQASNARVPGVIRFAGAAPDGFANGALASIAFKPVSGRALGRITVSVSEANSTSGTSLLGETRATGWPASPATSVRPVIDSITPRSAEVGPERVTDLVLYGSGFAEKGNTILFGGAEITGLASEKSGTVIRFLAPSEVPARGSRASHRLTAGPIEVRVRHASGTSNAVTFAVKEDS